MVSVVLYCNFRSLAFLGLLGFLTRQLEIKFIATLLSAAKWCIKDVPKDWHSPELGQMLEQGFNEATFLPHLLHKGTRSYRFRASAPSRHKP